MKLGLSQKPNAETRMRNNGNLNQASPPLPMHSLRRVPKRCGPFGGMPKRARWRHPPPPPPTSGLHGPPMRPEGLRAICLTACGLGPHLCTTTTRANQRGCETDREKPKRN